MTDEIKLIDIKTGKQVQSKQRTGQDSKRWRKLLELLNDGTVRLEGLGGIQMKPSEINEFIGHLDDIIKIEKAAEQRLIMRKRRSTKYQDD